jgi:hypothetical protein
MRTRKPRLRSGGECVGNWSGYCGLLFFTTFLGFLALRGTSQRFISEVCKFLVVKAIAAISLVKRGFPKGWASGPPLSARIFKTCRTEYIGTKILFWIPVR